MTNDKKSLNKEESKPKTYGSWKVKELNDHQKGKRAGHAPKTVKPLRKLDSKRK